MNPTAMQPANTALAEALALAVRPHLDIASGIEERMTQALDSIRSEMREHLATMAPKELVVIAPSGERVNVGRQHQCFETLVRIIGAGCSAWLAGPAGSGKTVAAEHAAKSLGLAFSAVSIGPQTTQSHLFGYMDATGVYRGTEVRARFEQGGILLLDEIDRGNPGVLTALNALLANNVCAFPDGMVQRHESFRVVAAANTIGMGADRQYVGALQLDAATLDRFVFLAWPYDEDFEQELADAAGARDWCKRVQALRKAAEGLGVRHVISPRATLHGAKLLAAGLVQADVERMTIWRGLDDATRERIEAATPMTAKQRDAVAEDTQDDEDASGAVTSASAACPRCGKSSSVIRSKFSVNGLVCWKRRHGCGHKWQGAA